jgi:translocation and assembly module TamB
MQGRVTTNRRSREVSGHAQATIQLDARKAGVPGTMVEHVTVAGRIDDPTTHAVVALQIAAEGIDSNGVTGNAKLDANGPQEALRLKLSSELHHATQGEVPLDATATLDASAKQIAVATLHAQYKGQPVQLLAPVQVSFRGGVAVDRLRLGMQQAVLEVAGRISPTLDLTASLRNVTPAVAKTVDVDLQADGTLTMDARLSGTIDEPRGTVKVAANGLRMRTGSAARLPAANLTASADLDGQSARVDASSRPEARPARRGRSRSAFEERIDRCPCRWHHRPPAVANPILEVNGRRVKAR